MIANVSILLFCSLCLAYAGLNAYALLRAHALIFPVPPSSYEDDDSIFKLTTRDGISISAYFLSADPRGGSPAGSGNHLLIYSHGNGEDIGMARPFLELFQKRGISVLTFDYPGYGTSGGEPSEPGCYAAIEAAYAYAVDTLDYNPSNITLYGRSLGSGPSTWLAQREPVRSIILDGAFTSTFRVMTGIKLLPWDRFDNFARLPDIDCPVLLIHGTEDRTVPFSHAQQNWHRIEGPKQKLFIEGARHGNLIELADDLYWDTVVDFIQKLTPL
ncbi:MAG: alpha/beta fold hydrolase [Verrucomicrobia bacterium]|jgi:pimeloyl-ACP methyl ester carboxylesterase|nr:alpha/beta fold hydrolase [Verrucomicrobiota bacterium]